MQETDRLMGLNLVSFAWVLERSREVTRSPIHPVPFSLPSFPAFLFFLLSL